MDKKLVGLMLASSMLLVACGGGGDTSSEDTGEEETERVEEVEEEEIEEEEVEEESSGEIVLGEEFILGDYKMTITDLSLSSDYEGNDALVITYDWENGSEDSASPFMTFGVKAYQEGVETDDVWMVEGEDLSVGQKEVKSGGKIEGATKAVGIEDVGKSLEIEIKELFSFSDEVFTKEVDLNGL